MNCSTFISMSYLIENTVYLSFVAIDLVLYREMNENTELCYT